MSAGTFSHIAAHVVHADARIFLAFNSSLMKKNILLYGKDKITTQLYLGWLS